MRRLVLTAVALVVFGTGVFNLVLPAKEPATQQGIGLGFAVEQEGSPLQIQGTESVAASGAYTKVTVKNVSARVVTGTTFAVRVVAKPDAQSKTSLHEGRPLQVRIEPGAIVELTAQVLSQQELDDIARANKGGRLQLGVLKVQFADGAWWESDVKTTGRFSGKIFASNPNDGIPCSVRRAFVATLLASVGLHADGGYFTCQGTVPPIYCANTLNSCTEVICPNPNACPKQECQYIPPPAPLHVQ